MEESTKYSAILVRKQTCGQIDEGEGCLIQKNADQEVLKGLKHSIIQTTENKQAKSSDNLHDGLEKLKQRSYQKSKKLNYEVLPLSPSLSFSITEQTNWLLNSNVLFFGASSEKKVKWTSAETATELRAEELAEDLSKVKRIKLITKRSDFYQQFFAVFVFLPLKSEKTTETLMMEVCKLPNYCQKK